MKSLPRPPIVLDTALDDPSLVRRLVEAHGPYLPVQRYFASDAEYDASSGQRTPGGKVIVAPNFRGDWAYDEPLVEGVLPLLRHEGFARAAGELFGSDRVRPQIVYVNLTWQIPFPQGAGHTDVPAFRGFDRTRFPIWLLNAMGHSGLFEEERIRIATAVAWFYRGADGGFEYWPDGPDAPSRVHEGAIFNTAIVGDNDVMYHRVRPVGERKRGMLLGMTLDTRLEHAGGDAWRIADGDEARARLAYDDLRIGVSWKAQVFRDANEERRVLEGRPDLDLTEVLRRLRDDLDARGIACPLPADPLRDPAFVDTLARAYVRAPRLWDAA